MRDGSGRWRLGVAAFGAAAIPFAVIAALDPRIGLLRPRPAAEAQGQGPGAHWQDSRGQDSRGQELSGQELIGQELIGQELRGQAEGASQRPARLPHRPSSGEEPAPERPCPVCTAAPAGPDGPASIRGTLPDSDIQIPDVSRERSTQRERLIGWTAHPDRISGSAASLDLVGLVFTAPRPPGGGYRPLAVDLAGAPDRAVVLVAEQPLTVALTTVPPDRAASLGVEAGAAFTLAEGRPDQLAGFRALPYGAAEVAPVLDPLRFGPETLRGFCAALRLWAMQFGLPARRIRYTLVENPTRIALAGEAVRSDGTPRGRISGRRLARLCQT
ncbi:hypothetical protein LRS73_18195 [Methylobacterium currus]|uniref:hypothetical protein n=1 Tax=Methylobacterium currus TaxID=2051553 RepID=UPI001E47E57F|nr:hypothetical protein [Methylobacterium currus]UHC14477.1 hypothetical protein LRS73_18195 [Methylobacterium currus]